jgi:hypothetical protein
MQILIKAVRARRPPAAFYCQRFSPEREFSYFIFIIVNKFHKRTATKQRIRN